MSKTLSAEAEHKPYFTTKRMALIGVMTAVTCILGPFSEIKSTKGVEIQAIF